MDRTSDKQWLHDISHVGMRMGNLVKENSEIKEHVESYSLSSPLTPREALYGGGCGTFSLHQGGVGEATMFDS